MKTIKRIALTVVVLLVVAAGMVTVQLLRSRPERSGRLTLAGLHGHTEVVFDGYGIPHIYAGNEEDAWFALGFVQAQDRLFQMEMMRRVGGGRLAELFGADLVRTDAFFRTLGIAGYARHAAREYAQNGHEAGHRATDAYLRGINAFIARGRKPPEFLLTGTDPEPFTVEDIFLVSGYMAFSFQEAFRTDPALSSIQTELGDAFLAPLLPDSTGMPPPGPHDPSLAALSVLATGVFESLPVVPPVGSNAWAVAPAHSSTGKVLFCNDTHIGYGQPSVWYEAHVEYPGFGVYGNFLAGFPFPLVAHTRNHAWGLTMLEQDELDFYRETVDPGHPDRYRAGERWETMTLRRETIRIKDEPDSVLVVRGTRHGPVINDVLGSFFESGKSPVSMSWLFTRVPSAALQAGWGWCHAADMAAFRQACSLLESPGLNVVYGDIRGNIARWTCGRFIRRPDAVDPLLVLDGASGTDEPLGLYTFSENPHEENPPCGFVFSANTLPDTMNRRRFPGYYAPPERVRRLARLLGKEANRTPAGMRRIQADVINDNYAALARLFAGVLRGRKPEYATGMYGRAIDTLEVWNGSHGLRETGPVLFTRMLSLALYRAMTDDMDSALYAAFRGSHVLKSALWRFFTDAANPWWDDRRTPVRETRDDILAACFETGIRELTDQLGPEMKNWTWDRVHTVTYKHPMGQRKPLDRLFNVGPFPAPGSNETINKSGFLFDVSGRYPAVYGPAMRIVIDFADVEQAQSVLPTGESGNVLSRHYDDQAGMYLKCGYRDMLMNPGQIRKSGSVLMLEPGPG